MPIFIRALLVIALVSALSGLAILLSPVVEYVIYSNPGPRPAEWEDNPNAIEVTWYLLDPHGDFKDYEQFIYAVLEDERGWQRAGINFKQTLVPPDADIIIHLYEPETENPCNKERDELLRACIAGGVGLQAPIQDIYLPKIGLNEALVLFVNHEFGHAIGFYHLEEGVMRPKFKRAFRDRVSDGTAWPSLTEIHLLINMFINGDWVIGEPDPK